MHLFVDRLTPPEITIQGEISFTWFEFFAQQGINNGVALEETRMPLVSLYLSKRDMRLRGTISKPKRTLPEITLVQAVVKTKMDLSYEGNGWVFRGLFRFIHVIRFPTRGGSLESHRSRGLHARRWEVPTGGAPIELKDFLKNREQNTQLICLTETAAQRP